MKQPKQATQQPPAPTMPPLDFAEALVKIAIHISRQDKAA